MKWFSLVWALLTTATIIIELCPPWLFVKAATEQSEVAEQSIIEKMKWIPVSNSSALCNDFTKAGFFIRQNTSSKDWIVFLEGGGLCFDTDSCNRRFFVGQVRFVCVCV